jgi:hypothetical protein
VVSTVVVAAAVEELGLAFGRHTKYPKTPGPEQVYPGTHFAGNERATADSPPTTGVRPRQMECILLGIPTKAAWACKVRRRVSWRYGACVFHTCGEKVV